MIEIPGGAREWKRVSASGVRTTWSLCWHSSSSMCAMRTTSVSDGQSMNAHGSSGLSGDGVEVAGAVAGAVDEGVEVEVARVELELEPAPPTDDEDGSDTAAAAVAVADAAGWETPPRSVAIVSTAQTGREGARGAHTATHMCRGVVGRAGVAASG